MLQLIRDIGTKYKINVVLSSHLLEEVERIADNIVIIGEGKVAASGPIDVLRTRSGGAIAVLDEGHESVAAAIAARGIAVQIDQNRLLIGQDESIEELAPIVVDAIASADASLRRFSAVSQLSLIHI